VEERTAALLEAFAAHLDGAAPAPTVTADDAADVIDALHGELDRGIAARDAQAATLGRTIACARGCTACCETVIVGCEADAARVARWLRAQPEARARFEARYPAWRADAGDLIERVARGAATGDGAAVRAAMADTMARHVMCPFNHEGACEIYPVRPDACRVAHALDTSAECRPGGRAVVLDFVPITRFLERARSLEDAMQRTLAGAPATRGPLADRVRARL